jgi:Prolyl oligopeptidase family
MKFTYLLQKNHFLLIALASSFFSITTAQGFEWTKPNRTSWLFAPGIHSSERAAAKYCEYYETSTGQLVQTSNDFVVIGSPVQGINFPELVMFPNEQPQLWINKKPGNILDYMYNKITRWRNGINDRNERIYIEDKVQDGPEVCRPAINLKQINLAQELDIETYSLAYDHHVAKFTNTEIVLYGVSRGAATTFNFLATKYQDKKQNVKAVVLEGCFDSVRNVLKQKYPNMQRSSKTKELVERIFNSIYSSHDLNGIAPIKNVTNFPKNLPVLLITSKKDTVVPPACVWNMYHKLKEVGHKHVYILELDHSPHPLYMMEHEEDIVKYETVVHAFYKKYGVSYNPSLAKQGKALLNACQP